MEFIAVSIITNLSLTFVSLRATVNALIKTCPNRKDLSEIKKHDPNKSISRFFGAIQYYDVNQFEIHGVSVIRISMSNTVIAKNHISAGSFIIIL